MLRFGLIGPTSCKVPVLPQSGEPSLADKYEYVMHGKLYKYAVEEKSKKG
jgi:hypothetical protein